MNPSQPQPKVHPAQSPDYREKGNEPLFSAERELAPRLRAARVIGRQSWMRGPLRRSRDQIVQSLCAQHKLQGYRFEVDYFGYRYRGNLATFVDYMAFCYGSSAPSELGLLRSIVRYLRKRGTGPIWFVDVGANVGHHTLFMAGQADRVIAFEPFPEVLALLRGHLALNQIANVEVVPVALGEKDETLSFFPGTAEENSIGTFLDWNAPDPGTMLRLPIRNGDRLFEERNYPPIQIMKVDVEGFEPLVFRGLRERLHRDRPIILSELLDFTRKSYGSEQAFRECFYDDALFFSVKLIGTSMRYQLLPFNFAQGSEVLVIPAEMADFCR
ncbi:MAG: FkbM family methyltransferase [Acidobacteriaceae bacterium]